MAGKEQSKEKARPKSSAGSESGKPNLFVDVIFWALLVLVAYAVLKGMFQGLGFSFGLPSVGSFFAFVFDKLQVYSIFLSLVFFIGIIYFNYRMGELAHTSHERRHGHHDSSGHDSDAPHHPKAYTDRHAPNKRWIAVESRVNSFNESDWRLAIIEADIILNDMLGKIGFAGDGVADRLKHADKSTFHTLDLAWEAHKLRNRITHDGAAFRLSHEDAKKTIGLYKKVFDEFYFI